MTDDKPDNIVRPDFGDPRMVLDRNDRTNYCQHHFVVVRYHTRVVTCRQCKEEVDPFDILVSITQKWETCTWEQKKLEELQVSIEALKREESNIKSRLRSAHKLAAPESKTTIFFDELMRRLAEVDDHVGLARAQNWSSQFKWLNAEQQAAIEGAYVSAQRRIEDNVAKQPRRKRVARIVKEGE